MVNHRNNKFIKVKKNENEVLSLVSTTTVRRSTEKNEALREPVINKKKRKSAREIQSEIGIYGAFGRTLVDLHKQGR